MRISGLIIAVAALLWAAPALAFEADAGNRALPLYGWDRVSGDWVDLADMQGKWVLLENWATW